MSRKEKRELIEFLKNAGATTVFFIEIWAIPTGNIIYY